MDISSGAPTRVNGKMTASYIPGLGIETNFDMLGDTVLSF